MTEQEFQKILQGLSLRYPKLMGMVADEGRNETEIAQGRKGPLWPRLKPGPKAPSASEMGENMRYAGWTDFRGASIYPKHGTLEALRRDHPEQWGLKVVGKGRRARTVDPALYRSFPTSISVFDYGPKSTRAETVKTTAHEILHALRGILRPEQVKKEDRRILHAEVAVRNRVPEEKIAGALRKVYGASREERMAERAGATAAAALERAIEKGYLSRTLDILKGPIKGPGAVKPGKLPVIGLLALMGLAGSALTRRQEEGESYD
jgi:hypothetical protein